jgi:hypothetical protein
LRPRADAPWLAGLALVLFALFAYPPIAPLIGRPWTQVEVFGIAPDPTAVATLGILLAAERPHWGLLAVPLIWCAIGGATLWAMHSPDALVMPAAGVFAVLTTGWKMLSRARA